MTSYWQMALTCTLTLALLASAIPVGAGPLREFEADAIQETLPPKRHPGAGHHAGVHSDDGLGLILGELLIYPLVVGISYGGMASWERAAGESNTARVPGEGLLPMARVDGSWLSADRGVSALDLRGELGYGPFALSGRHTAFREHGSPDRLAMTQVYGLYRMSFGSQLEWDLGLGEMILDGARRTSGFTWTMPVLFHPTENIGIEFRPAWAELNGNTIQDYDLALLLGSRYISLKVGYRWLETDHTDLSGPEAGLVVSW